MLAILETLTFGFTVRVTVVNTTLRTLPTESQAGEETISMLMTCQTAIVATGHTALIENIGLLKVKVCDVFSTRFV